MLISLTVQNFAIIDNITIEFTKGMTVLTGETGAGKSLIIDALGLLFGGRASTDLIRFGETKALIEGVFSDIPPQSASLLEEEVCSEDVFIVRREIYASGKSLCRVNNVTVTLGQLAALSESLGDIHTQYDTQRLFNPRNYLNFIDSADINRLLADYRENYGIYQEAVREYENLEKKALRQQESIDLLRFQKEELEKASLSLEEEEELKNKSVYYANYEEINQNIKTFIEIYNKDNVLSAVYESMNILGKLSDYNEKYENYRLRVEEYYYGLADVAAEVNRDFQNFDYDENELETINGRLGIYSDFKRKYRRNIDEIILYYQDIITQISNIENYDFIIGELKNKVDTSYEKTLNIAKNLRVKRMEIAKKLETKILQGLSDLRLDKTIFKIVFNDAAKPLLRQNGIDDIDFMITFNPGEPLRSLSKVASGGELSRFMLALKALLLQEASLQTIIFDEVDTGVSGSIAYSIARKIKQIAENIQVLCVSHLPQVAAAADCHLLIAKEIKANRAVTMISRLGYEERVEEIGKMISNGRATDASRAMAKELLRGKNL